MSKEDEMIQQVLDAYFQFRRPLPENGYAQELKTTLDIQEELAPMAIVKMDVILQYMGSHDYNMTTDLDGSVKWAIWRLAGT